MCFSTDDDIELESAAILSNTSWIPPPVIVILPVIVTLPFAATEKFGVALFFPIDNTPASVILNADLFVTSLPTITSEPNLDCVTPPWTIESPVAPNIAFSSVSPFLNNSVTTP